MEEAKITIPETVEDTELVDRILYEPSFFFEGRLGPSAFALSDDGETYMSVFRDAYYCLKNTKLPKPRKEGDTAVGIAQLLTSKVKAISSPNLVNTVSLSVEAKPSRLYPFHAGIFTKVNNVSIIGGKNHSTPLYMYVQKNLVGISKVIMMADYRCE